MEQAMLSGTPLWEIKRISKAFPGVQALDGVSLAVQRGEVHALVGENGSGKSTLVKCLAGVHQPDAGELHHEGQKVRLRDPLAARAQGVAAFHQEFSLVPSLSVVENICLGRLPSRHSVIDWGRAREEALTALNLLGVSINPDAIVSDLSVAEQQFVEIAKALAQDASLLILDEPTAALGPSEVERLHRVIVRIAAQGRAILYISHRLDEVMQVADVITVIRDGRIVDSLRSRDTSVGQIVRMMIGADLDQHFPSRHAPGSEASVEVRGLRSDGGVHGVDLTIARGEVLGLGGISGSGRTAIARALFGIDRITGGEMSIDGERVCFRSPSEAIRAGVAMVPENRKAHGLFFNFASPENMTIADLSRLLTAKVLRLSRERQEARRLVDKLGIAGDAMERSVRFLSGGNQQKVVLARWLFTKVRLLILDEPTQGIDVSAKLEVYRLLNELSTAGLAILLISSDVPELLAMSDRVLVVRDGRIVHEAARGTLDEHALVEIAAGGVRVR